MQEILYKLIIHPAYKTPQIRTSLITIGNKEISLEERLNTLQNLPDEYSRKIREKILEEITRPDLRESTLTLYNGGEIEVVRT